MNNVVLVGRLTRDPELRFVPNTGTAVTTFSIAIDRDYTSQNGERQTDFLDIQVWNKQAETCNEYLKKGNMVCVQGSIRTDSYTDQSGVKRRSFRINANRVQFLTPKNSNTYQDKEQQFVPNFEPPEELDPNGFQAIDDEDLPF